MTRLVHIIVWALLLVANAGAYASWTVRYQHTDTLGSVIAESNTQGTITQRFDYKPFGEGTPTQKSGLGYTGHLEDTDLGLTYMQQRYYDPVIGRFYSNDPIGFIGVSTFNRYSYVGNNPYKYTVPTGMTRKSSYQQCEDDPQCENVIPQGDSASNPRNGNGAGDLKIKVSVKGIVSAAYSRNEGLTAEIAGSKHGFSLKANSNGEVSIGVNTLQGSEMSFRLNDSEKSYLHQIAQFKSLCNDLSHPL